MNYRHWMPPCGAILLFAIWTGLQRQSISETEANSRLLEQAIAKASRSAAIPSADAPQRKRNQLANLDQPIDWNLLGHSLILITSGAGIEDMATQIYLEQRLIKFSQDEFETALDEIAGLGLTKIKRLALEEAILEFYVERFPQAALERFMGEYSDLHFRAQERLAKAFENWVSSDIFAAGLWLDQKIAEGGLDRKTISELDGRTTLESILFRQQMTSDPSAAAARMKCMDLNERLYLMSVQPFSAENRLDYLAVIRSSFERTSEAGRALSVMAQMLVQVGGLDSVDQLIKSSDFTPSEVNSMVRGTINVSLSPSGTSGLEKFSEVADWGAELAPQVTAEVLGRRLASAALQPETSFSEMAQIVLQYQGNLNRDLLLESLIMNNQNGTEPEVAELIENISDAQLRAELTQNRN